MLKGGHPYGMICASGITINLSIMGNSGGEKMPVERHRNPGIMQIILYLLIMTVLLAGCEARPIFTFVVEDTTCEPPCWQGINPGETGREEAIRLLQNIPHVKSETITGNDKDYLGFDQINWGFDQWTRLTGHISLKDDVVIAIYFSPPIDEPAIQLGQAIERFGYPTHVFSDFHSDFPFEGELYFLFPEKGVICQYWNPQEEYKYRNGSATELRPETPLATITYVSKEMFSSYVQMSIIDQYKRFGASDEDIENRYYEWEGYGVISELYPAGTD